MVAEASLLVAALLSIAPHAPYSRMPMCDEAGVYEQDLAADALAGTTDALPPSAAACSEPAPLVLSCNDDPAGRWTQEMIGACDMPRTVAAPSLQRPTRDRSSMCRGSGCERDPSPLRAVGRGDEGRSSLTVSHLTLSPDFTDSPLSARSPLHPPSVQRQRLDRPPRT